MYKVLKEAYNLILSSLMPKKKKIPIDLMEDEAHIATEQSNTI